MPQQKRHSAARRSTKVGKPKAAKSTPRRAAKTKALAVTEAVRREPLVRARLENPLAAFEPLRRAVIDRQIAFLDMAMTWSPAHIIVGQQAAFWDGFVRDGAKSPSRAKPARKRTQGRKAKT